MEFLKKLKKIIPSVGPEYKDGEKMGEAYAKDAILKEKGAPHFKRPSPADAGIRARSFTEELKAQGKSDEFIKGFYFGFQTRYEELISTYHGA